MLPYWWTYGKKSAMFLYTTFARKIFGNTNDFDVPGGLQTTSRKTRSNLVAPEMFGLTCTAGAHISCYSRDTRLYPILSYPFSYWTLYGEICYVVVVRLEHSHSCNDSLDNHSTASGPAWCSRCRPPGNAVSGHSSTMCLVVWWLSPQGQAGDAIRPHLWRDSAHLAGPHLRRFSVTIQCLSCWYIASPQT